MELHDLQGYDAAQVAELVKGPSSALPRPGTGEGLYHLGLFESASAPATPTPYLNAFPSILTPASP